MAGTKEGAAKTRDINLARNPNHYSEIGAVGGKNSNTGGFATEKLNKNGLTGKEQAAISGKKGGEMSRRSVNGLQRSLNQRPF